jgi:hypothetical protein
MMRTILGERVIRLNSIILLLKLPQNVLRKVKYAAKMIDFAFSRKVRKHFRENFRQFS